MTRSRKLAEIATSYDNGTANGIAYLDGSKVLTTGYALTFDGTNLISPRLWQVQNAAAAYTTQILENSATNGYSQFLMNVGPNGANGQASIGYAPGIFFAIGPIANDTTTPIVFRLNNATEQMRLTSTGLGIGTSSPAHKLDVSGNGRFTGNLRSSGLALNGFATGTANGTLELGWDGNQSIVQSYNRTSLVHVPTWYDASYHRFNISGTERMRIDSSGNVQLSTAGTSILNSSGRKILNQTGSVLQVASTAYASAFTTSSGTPQATGLSVTITPASTSSKVLVLVTGNGRATASGGNCYVECWLYRSGTQIWHGFAQSGNFNSTDIRGRIGIEFLDSPATTSAVTYQLYIGSTYASSVHLNNGAGTSTITAMEISA